MRKGGRQGSGRTPLAAVAASVAAALTSATATAGAAARESVLPLRKPKLSPAAASPAAVKRGKQARPSVGTQLRRAVAVLAVATLTAAVAVVWYAASILHEHPAALAAATAEAQAALQHTAAAAPAARTSSSGSLAGNYTVVVMSCEWAQPREPQCNSASSPACHCPAADAAHLPPAVAADIQRLTTTLPIVINHLGNCPSGAALVPSLHRHALPCRPRACLLLHCGYAAGHRALMPSTFRSIHPTSCFGSRLQPPRSCWCGTATTGPHPRSSPRVRRFACGQRRRCDMSPLA